LRIQKVDDKETRPPQRTTGKPVEAKGIGTPTTRAEIIGGLKKQAFLVIQGKHIVPTEAGPSLFGILQQAATSRRRTGKNSASAAWTRSWHLIRASRLTSSWRRRQRTELERQARTE